MADNERQEQPWPQAPGQAPGQGHGNRPVPGPGMMPWGAPPPGVVLPPQGGQQFPQGGAQRGPQQAAPLRPGGPQPPGGPQQPGSPQAPGSPQQPGAGAAPQEPRRRPGYIDPDWKPSGSTMHDRMLELVQRYMDSALQDARGVQGMMMRDGANRMYPRIEATIRGMSEDELKGEIAAIQSQMRKVLGASEAQGRTSKAGTVKRRGRKQGSSGRR